MREVKRPKTPGGRVMRGFSLRYMEKDIEDKEVKEVKRMKEKKDCACY